MNTTLPDALEVSGAPYAIRTDYRCALDALAALNDVELDEREKALCVLCVLYEDPFAAAASDMREALERGVWYLNGGEESGGESRKEPRLMDWEQDFPLIVPPVSRVLGRDVRAPEPLHWWTFLSAYSEIGDCLFAQVVRIRDKLARNKKLDKDEREWYNRNRRLVDLRQALSEREQQAVAQWTGELPVR